MRRPAWPGPRSVACLIILLATASGCSRQTTDSPAPKLEAVDLVDEPTWPPDDRRHDRYLGSAACRECHQEIYETYMTHPMAASTRRCDAIIEPPFARQAQFQRSWREYTVDVDDAGTMSHSEAGLSPQGETLYRQAVEVEFAVGSGQRGFSFLINRDGRLFQSSLTWYTKQKDWDLSPGYRPELHRRFERRVSDGCVVCHAGRPIPVEQGYHAYEAGIFAELAIGCERCHGPGQRHVAFHSNVNATGDDPIVNPAKLSPLPRESVCYQCHLHGLDKVLRTGREELDFRPGDLISDIWAIFARGAGIKESGSTTAVSQVEQIVASRCHQGSQEAFGCTSCHDPHRLPREEERTVFYRSRCQQCHSENDRDCQIPLAERLRRDSENSCINCHMPRLSADDVPHTSQTDHRILRNPFERSVAPLPGTAEIELFEPRDFSIPDREAQRAYGLMLSSSAVGSGSPRRVVAAANALATLATEDSTDVPVLAAQALNLLAMDDPRSVTLAERAHALAPSNESVLETLAIYHERQGDSAKCLQFAEKFLALNAANSLMLERKARALFQLDRLSEALTAAEAALHENPTSLSTRELLIQVARQLGRKELVDDHTRILETMKELMKSPGPVSGGGAP